MGTIREQDWRIRSEIEIPIAPSQGALFEVGFVFKSDTQTEVVHVQTKDDYDKLFNDDSEEKNWAPWNERAFYAIPFASEQTILEDIKKAGKSCFILIFSLEATQAMKDRKLDWWGIQFYQNSNIKPWEDENAKELCLQERTGVFCDPEKEGKAFYTITKLLSAGYPTISNLKSDISSFSSCFNTLEHRDALLETGFSWYKDTKQGVSIWDVFVGGYQFKAIMGLFIADDEAKAIYADYIASGKPITLASIGEVEVSIGEKLTQLVEEHIIASFNIKKTPMQTPANLVRGIVKLGEKECGLINEYNLISYVIKGV